MNTKISLTPPTLTPEHRRILLEAIADHFRLHALRCRIRGCRRRGACDGEATATGKPACFGHLHTVDVESFDKIMTTMTEIYRGSLWPPPAKSGDRKWREDKAFAIYRASLARMPERTNDFKRVHERFFAPPAEPFDVKAFLIEAKLELARGEHNLAMIEARDRVSR